MPALPFLSVQKLLTHSLVFCVLIRAAPKSQISWGFSGASSGALKSFQDPLPGRSKDPCRKVSVVGMFASKIIVLQNPFLGSWTLAVGAVHSLVCRRVIPG